MVSVVSYELAPSNELLDLPLLFQSGHYGFGHSLEDLSIGGHFKDTYKKFLQLAIDQLDSTGGTAEPVQSQTKASFGNSSTTSGSQMLGPHLRPVVWMWPLCFFSDIHVMHQSANFMCEDLVIYYGMPFFYTCCMGRAVIILIPATQMWLAGIPLGSIEEWLIDSDIDRISACIKEWTIIDISFEDTLWAPLGDFPWWSCLRPVRKSMQP